MLTHDYHRYRRWLIILPILVGVTLLAASMPTQASGPAAPAAAYQCTPAAIGDFWNPNRVHVRCTVPLNTNIYYFAFCSDKDSATASRLLSIFTTAKATGKNLYVYYTAGDTSGSACGCSTTDCQAIWGAEVLQ